MADMVSDYMLTRLSDWGVKRLYGYPGDGINGLMGALVGTEPELSVVDADHRAWGIPNLFVTDGSVMPTQGSANPALTIMALASRLARRLARKQVRRPSR